MDNENNEAEPSGASGGYRCVAFLLDAARLIAVLSVLISLQIRANADNFRTHWPVAWVNVNGVTQVEVYVPPRGMPIIRLNWIE
jgi:hypothetical protein